MASPAATSGGANDTNIAVHGEHNISNSTTKTSDPSLINAADSASILVAFSLIKDEKVEWFRLTNGSDSVAFTGDLIDSGDTYVDQANPANNYGTTDSLYLYDSQGASGVRRILIRFT